MSDNCPICNKPSCRGHAPTKGPWKKWKRREVTVGKLIDAERLPVCRLCGNKPNTEPLHGSSGPVTVVCSNAYCLLGNMAVNPEKWIKSMSGRLDAPAPADLPGGLLDSLRRIADMKDRDGNVIDMTAQELQGIARRAIACHEAISAPAAAEVNADGLLPCPFCGGSDITLENICEVDDWSVECNACRLAQHAYHTRERAIKQWNTRAAGGGG